MDQIELYLALTYGEKFGWAVCSDYLRSELSKKIKAFFIDFENIKGLPKNINSKVLHTLTSVNFEPLFDIKGKENYAYTFFENELNNKSIENSKNYDLIFCGSTWCTNKLKEKGINHVTNLIQGVDHDIFYPEPDINFDISNESDKFIIFSGGKFEFRKGQDLVLKAFKILQDKYKDIYLVNIWENVWPNIMQTMHMSKHIKFRYRKLNNWLDFMNYIYKINGIKSDRIITYPAVNQDQLREIYLNSDIGVFPNRCEGGTNLVLMEYMACGKPVIASYSSGHKDILNNENSLLLKDLNSFELNGANKIPIAIWDEPSLEELIEKIEYAYHNRESIKKIGSKAGLDLKKYSWEKSAETVIKNIFKRKYMRGE